MSLFFYGERGLVNGIVLDLINNDLDIGLKSLKRFLKSIKFCNSYKPSWISKVYKADFIIEPSFSEFGDPDLIIVCYCTDNEKHIIFLEAKVVKYEDSAVNLHLNSFKGINSRINAQLTLKYRLANSLKERVPGGSIEEDLQYWKSAYAKFPTELSGNPRRVKNKKVINLCDKCFLDVTDFWFAALVNNKQNDMPFDESSIRPLLFNAKGENAWNEDGKRFGFITYSKLDEIMNPSGNYFQAKKFISMSSPEEQITEDIPAIRSKPWTNFSDFIKTDLRKVLQDMVEEAISKSEAIDAKEEQHGSDSYKSAGRTIIKLIPQCKIPGERIILAVRKSFFDLVGDNTIFYEGPFNVGIGKNSRSFVGISFSNYPSEDKKHNIIELLKEIWCYAVEQ